jgi:cholesterol transport system auxiliary component
MLCKVRHLKNTASVRSPLRLFLLQKNIYLAVIAGLSLANCAGQAPATFDLRAIKSEARSIHWRGQWAIAEPSTVQAFSGDRLIVKDNNGSLSYLGGGQWADNLPVLVQTRLIQSFENAAPSRAAIGRAGGRITPDYQLNSEIRSFHIEAETQEAVVEISAKIINDRNGRILATRTFSQRVAISSISTEEAAKGLDAALSLVMTDIRNWISASGR